MAASYEMTGHHRAAYDLAIRAMQPLYGTTTLVKVNDLRGHAAVLALFDEVIVDAVAFWVCLDRPLSLRPRGYFQRHTPLSACASPCRFSQVQTNLRPISCTLGELGASLALPDLCRLPFLVRRQLRAQPLQRLASIEAIEHDLDEGRPLVALIEPRIPQFEMHGVHADRLIADREEIEEQIVELQVR